MATSPSPCEKFVYNGVGREISEAEREAIHSLKTMFQLKTAEWPKKKEREEEEDPS